MARTDAGFPRTLAKKALPPISRVEHLRQARRRHSQEPSGRVMACQQLGWTEVPTIRLDHLTEAQARAFMIADNRLTENSVWDDRLLAEQLEVLAAMGLDFSLDVTGFEIGEIDLRIEQMSSSTEEDSVLADRLPEPVNELSVTRPGDLWLLNWLASALVTSFARLIDTAELRLLRFGCG